MALLALLLVVVAIFAAPLSLGGTVGIVVGMMVLVAAGIRRRRDRVRKGAEVGEHLDAGRAPWKGEPTAGILAELEDCTFLGGDGYPLERGSAYHLGFSDSAAIVGRSGAVAAMVPFEKVTNLRIEGPGVVQSGGGFFGGGFGLKGAAEGMVAASLLNALTTKTAIKTIVWFETASGELIFHYGGETPEALRYRLSPVFTRLRAGGHGTGTATADDLSSRLARLVEMKAGGSLSEEEFEAAKRQVLGLDPPAP